MRAIALSLMLVAACLGCDKPAAKSDSKDAGKPVGDSPVASKKRSKAEFRAAFKKAAKWSDSQPPGVAKESVIVAEVGKPERTRTQGGVTYWTYSVSDGTMEIVIENYGQLGKDNIYVKEINDH